MTTILCYGDSNTWGYEPGTGRRYAHDVRWPGVLQARLGEAFRVIEEGLNGRTTVLDDPIRVGKNGLTYLQPCLDTHAPLDAVVLMLGTNDLKHRYGLSPFDIAAAVAVLVGVIQMCGCGIDGKPPEILLVSPPWVGPLPDPEGMFAGAEAKSRGLAVRYRAVAAERRCGFLDAAPVAAVSPLDGVHLDAAAHTALGEAVAASLRTLFS